MCHVLGKGSSRRKTPPTSTTVSYQVATPAPDPLSRRKRRGGELDGGTAKRLRQEAMNMTPEERYVFRLTPNQTKLPSTELSCMILCVHLLVLVAARLNEAVTPLLSTPYPEQLKIKEKAMAEFLKKMSTRILRKDSNPVNIYISDLQISSICDSLRSLYF